MTNLVPTLLLYFSFHIKWLLLLVKTVFIVMCHINHSTQFNSTILPCKQYYSIYIISWYKTNTCLLLKQTNLAEGWVFSSNKRRSILSHGLFSTAKSCYYFPYPLSILLLHTTLILFINILNKSLQYCIQFLPFSYDFTSIIDTIGIITFQASFPSAHVDIYFVVYIKVAKSPWTGNSHTIQIKTPK